MGIYTGGRAANTRSAHTDATPNTVRIGGGLRATRYVGATQNATELAATEQERAWLASAVEQTADSIWMQDLDNVVTYVNPSFTRVYGYEPDEIVGRFAGMVDSGRHDANFFTDLWATVAAGATWTGSIVNVSKGGTYFEVEAVISAMRDAAGRVIGYMQTDRDVTRERELESAIEREARERKSIESALARIDSATTPEEIAASACTEIVGLSNVQTAFVLILEPRVGFVLAIEGRHAPVIPAGTLLPKSLLRHLRVRAGDGPWVESWRLDVDDRVSAALTRMGLHSVAFAPFACLGDAIGLVGIAAYDSAAAARLIERLPALVTFGSIVGTLVRPRLGARRLAAADRTAIQTIIDTSAFRPHFQPIVDLRDGAVVGYEALTRFSDGRPPNLVFSDAARSGYGTQLEVACLRASIEAGRRLPADAYLSLNASPEVVLSGALVALLRPVDRPIIVEITEHVAIDDYGAVCRELRRLGPGVRLAVDDAGAGYASFRHILELNPDFVKVDIDLVRNLDNEPARQALIAGMGYFAAMRGLHLIAEGIETARELDALRGLGVPFGQGYLLGGRATLARRRRGRHGSSCRRSIAHSGVRVRDGRVAGQARVAVRPRQRRPLPAARGRIVPSRATLEPLITPTIARASRRRPSRIAILAVFGALLVAACGNPPSPSPSLPASPSAAPSSAPPSSGAPSASPTAVACAAIDIRATGGPWGGAAGSRGSDIVVTNQGTAPCLLPASPTVALVDAFGTVLLSTPARAGSGPSVAPGGTVGFSVLFGNWCAQGAQLPLHLRLALAGDAVEIANLVVSSTDELPPCNGPGEPASLSTTDWQTG